MKPTTTEIAPIVIEKVYPVTPERVWKAITDKDQMKEWYFDLEEFEAKVGFRFKFNGKGHNGETYTHVCTVTEVILQEKLQYSWTYEGYKGYSLVTFELFRAEEGTVTTYPRRVGIISAE